MKSRLIYWRPETVDREVSRNNPLNHSGSEQLDHVKPGEDVWVVTVRDGKLAALGCIKVGYVGDSDGAAALLDNNDLWDASFHIVSVKGTARPIKEVPIGNLAERLRFNSPRDRLSVVDGRVNAQQLQTMRELTAESAAELAELFDGR